MPKQIPGCLPEKRTLSLSAYSYLIVKMRLHVYVYIYICICVYIYIYVVYSVGSISGPYLEVFRVKKWSTWLGQ